MGFGGFDSAVSPDGICTWFPPGVGTLLPPLWTIGGLEGCFLPPLPCALVNAFVRFPPGAIGLALVPVRGAGVRTTVRPVGGLVGLKPLALLNCRVGRGGW